MYFTKNLKILLNQQNSKSNELIKMTRAFHPYLTFTGEPQVRDLIAPRFAA